MPATVRRCRAIQLRCVYRVHTASGIRLNNASNGRLTSQFRLDGALAVDLRDGGVRGRRLVHKHHLVGVLRHLAAGALVQVAGLLGLARTRGRVGGEVHVMAHLNACFGDVDYLLHEVLVRHLKILVLGLLML